MVSPRKPANEAERLRTLRRSNLLHTPAEERFDRITRIAARVLEVPMALVSLVSEDEQWFKSSQGLAASSTSRDISFCGHAVAENRTLVVEDTSVDSRFADNPLVTGAPNIRFYAGEPLRIAGQPVGTLCILDSEPHNFSIADLQVLKDLAALIEVELEREELGEAQKALIAERTELERRALIDPLTRLWNRGAIFELLSREVARAGRGADLTVAMIDVDNFKSINDAYGHPAGDRVLAEIAARLRGAVRECDSVGRYGGEEFLAVLPGCSPNEAKPSAARIVEGVSRDLVEFAGLKVQATVSVGYACYDALHRDASSLLESADSALYKAKLAGRNRALAYAP